ncbi:MAG: hypothetical protein JNL58_30500 [Planctomyces sp.]|nr:hypothetical protein [Planctomyces sp.]
MNKLKTMVSSIALAASFVWIASFVMIVLKHRNVKAFYAGVVAGWMLLPQVSIDLPGQHITKYKILALVAGLLLPIVRRRESPQVSLGLTWVPALGMSVVAFASSISNNMGPYDGMVSAIQLFLLWGLPWLIGVKTLTDNEDIKAAFYVIIVASLLYLPLCYFEMKMAPVLHNVVYGYEPRSVGGLGQHMRFGFWRPRVFLEHGLQLSLFMGMSSVLAASISFSSGRLARTIWVPLLLAASTVFMFSTGAILLMFAGWMLLLISKVPRTYYVFALLSLIPVVYPLVRIVFPGVVQVEVSEEFRPSGSGFEERERSLAFRVRNEELLLERWRLRPLLGWTPWHYYKTTTQVVPDSLWILSLAKHGLLGWGFTTATLILPAIAVLRGRVTTGKHFDCQCGVIAIVTLMYALDCLANNMPHPVLLMLAGGAASCWRGRLTGLRPESTRVVTSQRSRVSRRSQWPPRATFGSRFHAWVRSVSRVCIPSFRGFAGICE